MDALSLQGGLASLSLSEVPLSRSLPAAARGVLQQCPFFMVRLGLRPKASSACLSASVRPNGGSKVRTPLVRAVAADATVMEDEMPTPDLPPLATFKLHGTGRRKTAVARVGLIEGTGYIQVNGLSLEDYFQGQLLMIQAVKLPLSSLGYESKYDLKIKAHGGGLSAQAGAMVMGIARALCMANLANRPPLKAQGMLRRDPRAVERKKYGLKKARKAPQFSKR